MALKKITEQEIRSIREPRTYHDCLTVKRVGGKNDVFAVIGYNYGEEKVKLTGSAVDVEKFLNGYFGLSL